MGYLEHHMNEISSFIEREEKRYSVAFANGPEGTLQRAKVNGSDRYIHSISDPKGHNRYVRRVIHHDPDLIRSLATKEYARLALRQLERSRRYIDSLSRHIRDIDQDELISAMKPAYRTLPANYFSPDADGSVVTKAQRDWASQPYEMSDFRPGERTKKTSRGLYVRSKSEVLLAEKFYEYEIPFRYEQVIHIGKYKVAPDFTFLDSNGKEFYLEYCGLMDDYNYLNSYLWKRDRYESIGINEWENMIYIYEKNNEIHLDEIEGIIRHQVLPRAMAHSPSFT